MIRGTVTALSGGHQVRRSRPGILFLFCALIGMLSPALAACPYDTDGGGTVRTAFAAGCMIRIGDGLLLVRHRFTGKLGVPAGYSSGQEPPRCTAYRETIEETGIEVTVHELLREFGSGFHLYHCRPAGEIGRSDDIDVPASGVYEISTVILIDPATVPQNEWRFPEQHSEMLSLFGTLDPL